MSKAAFKRITLHLARTRDFPEGSARHGYSFIAPLDAEGHIDVETWKAEPGRCIVHRVWPGEPSQTGRLVRRAGGTEGATWGFDYDRTTAADDEAGFRFGAHAFKVGEYVSIKDPDDEMHTFKIFSVVDA